MLCNPAPRVIKKVFFLVIFLSQVLSPELRYKETASGAVARAPSSQVGSKSSPSSDLRHP